MQKVTTPMTVRIYHQQAQPELNNKVCYYSLLEPIQSIIMTLPDCLVSVWEQRMPGDVSASCRLPCIEQGWWERVEWSSIRLSLSRTFFIWYCRVCRYAFSGLTLSTYRYVFLADILTDGASGGFKLSTMMFILMLVVFAVVVGLFLDNTIEVSQLHVILTY